MSQLYGWLGITRQAHAQAINRQQHYNRYTRLLLIEVDQIRKCHPRMGMARLYDLIQPEGLGRDRFIELLKVNGYQLTKKRNYRRTTWSLPHLAYENRIKGLRIDGTNQLWVSDITYYRSGEHYYYLTFILDVYSRRIVGYAASNRLAAEANVKAVKRALRLRKGQSLDQLIHHSDRGSQYLSKQYTQLLSQKGIKISMGNKAWENAHAERINRTIKNDYLYPKGKINSLKCLQRKLAEQVRLYNQQRPHMNLPERLNPVAFEQLVAQKQLDYCVQINY